MIIDLPAVAAARTMLFASPCDRVRSTSETGQKICLTLTEVSAHLRSSQTFGEQWQQTVRSLRELLRECSAPGWDGYGAEPISPQTASNALDFIRTIPFSLPQPEMSATSAGEVTFEWAVGPWRIVTVAVGETGEVHYASLDGPKKTFGSYPQVGSFEPELFKAIESVLG